MKNFVFIFVMLFGLNAFSQNILLEESPVNDTVIPKTGPNLKRFNFFYVGYEFVVDDFTRQSATVKKGASNLLFFGLRHKHKINDFWSVGYDFNFSTATYSISQNSKKIFPSIGSHKKERLIVSALGLQLFTRINFDRRGNKIGKYIDLGGYANWDFSNSHFTKDKTVAADSSDARIINVTEQKLKYLENYEYGVKARLGSNHLAICASYRISDLIKPSYNYYPELPKLSIGIEIGIY